MVSAFPIHCYIILLLYQVSISTHNTLGTEYAYKIRLRSAVVHNLQFVDFTLDLNYAFI